MKRVAIKALIFLGYFLATFILKKIGFWPNLIFWFVGAVLGAHFLKLDQLIHVYITESKTPLALEVKGLLGQRKLTQVWDLLEQRIGEQKNLVSRSVLFQTGWVFLAFFVLTSTRGVFGKAFIMALGLHLLIEEWEDFLVKKNIAWLFWPIKREITFEEQRWFLWLMTGVFSLLTLLLI